MVLGFALQTFCVLISCFLSEPEVKVQSGPRPRESRDFFDLDTKSPPLVHTESGWVEGYFQKTILGRPIAAFEGIPYGKPPERELRFRVKKSLRIWVSFYKKSFSYRNQYL
jgi:hypothetical protein